MVLAKPGSRKKEGHEAEKGAGYHREGELARLGIRIVEVIEDFPWICPRRRPFASTTVLRASGEDRGERPPGAPVVPGHLGQGAALDRRGGDQRGRRGAKVCGETVGGTGGILIVQNRVTCRVSKPEGAYHHVLSGVFEFVTSTPPKIPSRSVLSLVT